MGVCVHSRVVLKIDSVMVHASSSVTLARGLPGNIFTGCSDLKLLRLRNALHLRVMKVLQVATLTMHACQGR